MTMEGIKSMFAEGNHCPWQSIRLDLPIDTESLREIKDCANRSFIRV